MANPKLADMHTKYPGVTDAINRWQNLIVLNNQNGADMKYQGPMTQLSGFKLAAGSAGRNAASDGLDIGARIG